MLQTVAAAFVILVASVLVGQAIIRACGQPAWSWLAPGIGLAGLIVLASLAIRLPGGTLASLIVLGLAVLAALAWLARAPRPRPDPLAAVVALLTLAATAIPFVANARVGLLGVSFNNDLSVHLVWTEALKSPALAPLYPVPPGYPLGPHAVVATLAELGIATDFGFVGLLIAIPVITALTALAALQDVPRAFRAIAAPLVALPYLAASYYAQGAFKETLQALLLLVFVLALRDLAARWPAGGPRAVVPLALIAAATVYNYSYYGVAWPLGAVGIWLAFELAIGRLSLRAAWANRRALLVPGLITVALGVLVLAPELPRVVELFREVSLSPSAAGAITPQNVGNLAKHISGYEALGIWPHEDFRFLPPDVFRAGMYSALALGVALFGGLWWMRRRDLTVPAAIAASTLVYLFADQRGESAYLVAKALVVPTPLIMLMGLRALMRAGAVRSWFREAGVLRIATTAAFLAGALWSSFVTLEGALVGPRDHARDLAGLRPLLAGSETLFLGYDDFIGAELRGVPVSNPGTLSKAPVSFRAEKPWQYGQAFDFDSVNADYLDLFDYVITTRTRFASGPPANFRPAGSTRFYQLWERAGRTAPRRTLAEAPTPAAELRCSSRRGRRLARRRGTARVMPAPILGTGPQGLLAGQSGALAIELPAGEWDLSVQYTSSHGVSIDGAGMHAKLPPNLDRPGPFWPLGTVTTIGERGRAPRIEVSVDSPSMLSAPSHLANFGQVVAMPSDAGARELPLRRACGRYVDWYKLKA